MKRKQLKVISILGLGLSLSAGICFASFRNQSLLTQGDSNKSRKVRLGLIGYVLLPDDYRAHQTEDLRDAWYGYIASPSKDTIRIRYTAGLVESPFQHGKKKFVWLRSENNNEALLKYGLLKKENGGQMAARVGAVNFYATVNSEAQKELFLGIVRSYKPEQCTDCEPDIQSAPATKPVEQIANTETGTTLSLGMSHQSALQIIRECGGQDITGNLAVVGPHGEWPLSGLFWHLEQYNSVLEIVAEDGNVVAIGYWTIADFSKSKVHISKSKKRLKSLIFDKHARTVKTQVV